MPLINKTVNNRLDVALCSQKVFIQAIKEGEEGNSPLHYAVKSGNENLVNMILEDDINPNVTNCEKQTPLHLAATNNKPLMISALVKNKGNINARDRYGNKLLLLACGNYKNRLAIRKLIKLKADITLKNHHYAGPLATLALRSVQKFDIEKYS